MCLKPLTHLLWKLEFQSKVQFQYHLNTEIAKTSKEGLKIMFR